jgi:hypothetical protein
MKFKARLYIQNNLQELVYKDTYTTTLVIKSFRVLMAIITIFNLNCWQGDAINAFTNSPINKIIYIKYPDGFTIKGKYLLLHKVLYRLQQSPLL